TKACGDERTVRVAERTGAVQQDPHPLERPVQDDGIVQAGDSVLQPQFFTEPSQGLLGPATQNGRQPLPRGKPSDFAPHKTGGSVDEDAFGHTCSLRESISSSPGEAGARIPMSATAGGRPSGPAGATAGQELPCPRLPSGMLGYRHRASPHEALVSEPGTLAPRSRARGVAGSVLPAISCADRAAGEG